MKVLSAFLVVLSLLWLAPSPAQAENWTEFVADIERVQEVQRQRQEVQKRYEQDKLQAQLLIRWGNRRSHYPAAWEIGADPFDYPRATPSENTYIGKAIPKVLVTTPVDHTRSESSKTLRALADCLETQSVAYCSARH